MTGGLAYEAIKLSGKFSKAWLLKPVIWPGLMLQKITTSEPDDDQLLDIARASARTWTALFSGSPRIAALSFSTRGSADHPAAARMAAVARRLAEEAGAAPRLPHGLEDLVVGDRDEGPARVPGRGQGLAPVAGQAFPGVGPLPESPGLHQRPGLPGLFSGW